MRKQTLMLLSAALFAFVTLVVPAAMNGTVLVPKDLEDLVTESSDIVLGNVIAMSNDWNKERTRIYTTIVLEVERGIKGDFETGEKIRFQTIGGTVGEVSLRVPASPAFNIDERAVVFFGGEANINTPVTGWEQGKYTVENDVILENGRYLDDFIGEIEEMLNRMDEQDF